MKSNGVFTTESRSGTLQALDVNYALHLPTPETYDLSGTKHFASAAQQE